MRKHLAALLIFCSWRATAQLPSQSDSLYLYNLENARLQLQYQNAAFLIADTSIQRAGILQFTYNKNQGGYHKAMEPYSSQIVTLYTQGIASLGKVKVAGSLRINKIWDDSLSNNLNGDYDDATPYFYAAAKAGTYERQNYNFKVVAAWKASTKWSAGLGLDYDYHWTTGSVDPRPDVKVMTYVFKPELVYQAGKHTLSVQGSIGKGNESSDIRYKNRDFQLSNQYPDRIFYLNFGYGYIAQLEQSIYQRLRTYTGAAFHHTWKGASSQFHSSLTYRNRSDINTKEKNGQSKLAIHSRWYLQDYAADFTWNIDRHETKHQVLFNGLVQRGHSWDSLFNASNYHYGHQQVSLSYTMLRNGHARFASEWGAGIIYNGIEKTDFLQAHHIKYALLQPSVSGGLYWKLKNGNKINAILKPSLRLPVTSMLSVPPTQENVFTQQVVYPDFYYWSSLTANAGLQVNFITNNIIKMSPVGIFGTVEYLRQLSTSNVVYNAAAMPSKNRVDVNIGFRIYL